MLATSQSMLDCVLHVGCCLTVAQPIIHPSDGHQISLQLIVAQGESPQKATSSIIQIESPQTHQANLPSLHPKLEAPEPALSLQDFDMFEPVPVMDLVIPEVEVEPPEALSG
ncbi:hypothetical protein BDN71DRAFT_1429107 [Pleurotus eryngii]|uniref:Uncharacterized protein n=1 Tax=Pleurotus eryngii TaxID=5323 RepID=A0A9P6DIJ4_PLEER|nr:hypothetical protein BDN71DRAFT_1429107 [Pleurotus eryngii]